MERINEFCLGKSLTKQHHLIFPIFGQQNDAFASFWPMGLCLQKLGNNGTVGVKIGFLPLHDLGFSHKSEHILDSHNPEANVASSQLWTSLLFAYFTNYASITNC